MEITLSKKQNEKLSNLIELNNNLQKELEVISVRQNDLIEIILDQHDIDIKGVKNVNLVDGILQIDKITENKE